MTISGEQKRAAARSYMRDICERQENGGGVIKEARCGKR